MSVMTFMNIQTHVSAHVSAQGIMLASSLSQRRCRQRKQSQGYDYLSQMELLEKYAILFLDSL